MSDSLKKDIIEATPKIDDATFNQLVDSTWEFRIGGRDDEKPDFPKLGELTYGVLTGELDEGKEEFRNRLEVVCTVLEDRHPLDIIADSLDLKITLDYGRASDVTINGNELRLEPWMVKNPSNIFFAFSLSNAHHAWSEARQKVDDLKHPLVPLIEAWFKRPLPVEPSRRQYGIAPKFASVIDTRRDSSFANLPDMTGTHGEIAAYLPGFEPQPPTFTSAPVLHLYDYLGGTSLTRGRAAPLTLRIFYEAVMSVTVDARRHPRFVELTLRDLRDWLYPAVVRSDGKMRSSYKPSKHLPLILQALHSVHNLRVSVIPDGHEAPTLWQPVSVRALPTHDINSLVRFEVLLPPGSTRGALVDRHVLRELGLQSALKYRAYIGLCYFWDKYGRTKNGRRELVSTRPVVARNEQGMLINDAGEPMLTNRGTPDDRWKNGIPLDTNGVPTKWELAAREINPNALSRYPVFTDTDLLELCYSQPDGTQADGTTRFNRLRKAKIALRQMQNEGHIIIVEDAISFDGNRRGWQILPP